MLKVFCLHAGEYYDAESGLYYLRARYYNPYIGRFISEDSYWGEDANPLSLNRYAYVHYDPINFYDPTGHWEQGDEELNEEVQAKIIALTTAYFNAKTDEERKAIRLRALVIRNDPKSKESVVTPLQFETEKIDKVVDRAVAKRGYMTKEEWDQALEDSNIETEVSSNFETRSTGPYMSSTATTKIGRTNLSVYSTADLAKQIGTSRLEISYTVTDQEMKFVRSMTGNEDEEEPATKIESILVLLEYLQRNNGKLTKDQLERAGFEYKRDFIFSNIGHIEMAYDLSMKDLTVAEAQMRYQQEVMNQQMADALGIVGMRALGGGRTALISLAPAKSTW